MNRFTLLSVVFVIAFGRLFSTEDTVEGIPQGATYFSQTQHLSGDTGVRWTSQHGCCHPSNKQSPEGDGLSDVSSIGYSSASISPQLLPQDPPSRSVSTSVRHTRPSSPEEELTVLVELVEPSTVVLTSVCGFLDEQLQLHRDQIRSKYRPLFEHFCGELKKGELLKPKIKLTECPPEEQEVYMDAVRIYDSLLDIIDPKGEVEKRIPMEEMGSFLYKRPMLIQTRAVKEILSVVKIWFPMYRHEIKAWNKPQVSVTGERPNPNDWLPFYSEALKRARGL